MLREAALLRMFADQQLNAMRIRLIVTDTMLRANVGFYMLPFIEGLWKHFY